MTTTTTNLCPPSHDWGRYNDLLVERGDLLQFLPRISAGFQALPTQNIDKDGRPLEYPDELFQVLAYQRSSFYTPWRQLQGHANLLCHLLNVKVPHFSTIYRRCQDVTLDSLLGLTDFDDDAPCPSKKQPETHCFDATGLKLSGPGEWLQKVHHPGTRKVWLKFHIDAIAPTHEIRVHALTGSDVGDGPMFVPLLTKAKQKGPVGKALGDKGYDAKDHFEACAKDHIVAGILPKKNASTRARGGPARAKVVWEIQKVGLKEWKKAIGYGERWVAERAFSIFKCVFGDKVRAREWDAIVQEVALKVQVLNYYMKRLNE